MGLLCRGKQRLRSILFFLFVGLYTGCQPEKIQPEDYIQGAEALTASVARHDEASDQTLCIEGEGRMCPSLPSQDKTCSNIFQQVLSIIKTIQNGGSWRAEVENLVYDSTVSQAQNPDGDFLLHVIINFLSGLPAVKDGKKAKNRKEKEEEELEIFYKEVLEFLKFLIIKQIVNPDNQDRYGKNALETAVEYGLLAVCNLIIDGDSTQAGSRGDRFLTGKVGALSGLTRRV